MSVSFRTSRKKRDFWGDDNELPSLNCFKKTRHIPPVNGFDLQGCSENKVGLLIAVRDLFPMLDEKTIASVLESYGDNLDMAIAKLEQLQLTGRAPNEVNGTADVPHCPPETSNGIASSQALGDTKISSRWVDSILQELFKSESQEDSRRRLEIALKAFEEAAIEHYKENSEEMKAAKKEFETMRKNNTILCKALTHKQERFKAQDQEIARLRAVLDQAEERIKGLEMSNYSLTLHLERAMGPKIEDHGRPPDIF